MRIARAVVVFHNIFSDRCRCLSIELTDVIRRGVPLLFLWYKAVYS